MLAGMRLKNFKSWVDTGDIRLAPLTVFFGRNSSGKSTLLQAPLLLKQTAESLDSRQALRLQGPDTYVDLGSFRDVIRDHDTSRLLEMTISWRLPQPAVLLSGSERITTDSLSLTTSIGTDHPDRQPSEMAVHSLRYTLANGAVIEMRRAGRGSALRAPGLDPSHSAHVFINPPSLVKAYKFPDQSVFGGPGLQILGQLPFHLERQLATLTYVGPLRSRPARTYQWPGSSPDSVGRDGENTVAALLASDGDFHATIARWLQYLGVVESFGIEAVAPDRDLYEPRVTAPGGTTPVSLIDVGFGVSQVLPVLVQIFYAARDSSIILEQPEMHLHPAAHSALGDTLLAAVRENNVQLLVETHSEHLLHRIQRRIAEERLVPGDIALYFVETSDNQSTLQELTVDPYGNIINWPQDFFGDEMGDLAEMTRAAARRRQYR